MNATHLLVFAMNDVDASSQYLRDFEICADSCHYDGSRCVLKSSTTNFIDSRRNGEINIEDHLSSRRGRFCDERIVWHVDWAVCKGGTT